MDFQAFRSWFDERFSILVQQKITSFASHSESKDVSDITQYILPLSRDGKRFRPFLVASASVQTIEDQEKHFLLFASVELLHLFALVHDDIMDDAETRHGVLCAHRAFKDQYGEHTAEAVAILLGDVIFSWAYDCLLEYTSIFPETREAIFREFKILVSEVTHGQILDVLSPVQAPLSRELIEQKMILKTARYSFVQPLMLGFVVSGMTEGKKTFARHFGEALGLGFQLQDDLIDTLPTVETGKTSCTDIAEKQQTLLSWYMRHEAAESDRSVFETFFGKKDMTEEERETLRLLITTSGARAYVEGAIADYIREAEKAIESFGADRDRWQSIITLVAQRKK